MAGDIFSAFPLRPFRQDADSRTAKRRAEKFCREELSKYKEVLYVPGNHEAWSSRIEDVPGHLRQYLAIFAPNVTLLDNDMVEIDGVVFMGTTLWCRNGVGSADEHRIANAMRDFEKINTSYAANFADKMMMHEGQRRFRPPDANRLYIENKQWLKESTPTDKPVVLITHHAPSFQSGHGVDQGAAYMDDAYCGNLVDFFMSHPNIKLAIHGHTHTPEHYRIGETLVVSNPRGYFPDQRVSRHFDATAEDIDLEDLKT